MRQMILQLWMIGLVALAMPAYADLPENYDQLSALEKQNIIWQQIESSAWEVTPEQPLPPLDGAGWGSILSKLGSIFSLAKSFDHDEDEVPKGREKIIHKYGVAGSISWVAVGNSKYTGLLSSNVEGSVRLSLAADPNGESFTPGGAFKLYIDGKKSLNFVAMNSVNGQGEDWNFFSRKFSTLIPKAEGFVLRMAESIFSLAKRPPNKVGVSRFAQVMPNGDPVSDPVTPDYLDLVPTEDAAQLIPSDSRLDFREELLKIPAGTELYHVYAVDAGNNLDHQKPSLSGVLVAKIVTKSELVASEYGDKKLFFKHERR